MRFSWGKWRAPLAGLAVVMVAVIFAADRFPIPSWLGGSCFLVAAVAFLWWPRNGLFWSAMLAGFWTLPSVRQHESPGRWLAGQLGPMGKISRVSGIVADLPTEQPGARGLSQSTFPLRVEWMEFDGRRFVAGTTIRVSWQGGAPHYGDRVILTGQLRNLEPPRNPGEFDERGYGERLGIFSELDVRYPTDGAVASSGHGNWWMTWAFAARSWMQRELNRDLESEPEIGGLVQSMVLGMKGDTPPAIKDLFQQTGTLHLFAVSGLNVAMLGAMAGFFLQPLARWRFAALLIMAPLLLFYALITGAGASSVRAALMAILGYVAIAFDRRAMMVNSLGATALVILLLDSNQLFHPGFQFSFVLVLAIAGLSRRIARPLAQVGVPDPFLPRTLWSRTQQAWQWSAGVLADSVGVCVAAWCGSLLFTAGYFHLISPSALIANLVAVPLAFVLLALACLALACAPLTPALTMLCNNASWLVAKILLACISFLAGVPGGHAYVDARALFGRAPAAAITVYDAGPGGAIHLRAGGEEWLLDCGSASDYERFIRPDLRARGVNRLSGLFLSHGDARHIGGALETLLDFAPRRVLDSPVEDRSPTRKEIAEAVGHSGRVIERHVAGDQFSCGPCRFRILHPPPHPEGRTADDKALVVQVEVAGVRVLSMSDSGFLTEQWLLEHEPDLRSDILVKGRHANDLSGTPDFLAAVQPQVIIQAGQNPFRRDRHAAEWLARVRAGGVAVFDQDESGAAEIAIEPGGAFSVRAFFGDQSFRSRSR